MKLSNVCYNDYQHSFCVLVYYRVKFQKNVNYNAFSITRKEKENVISEPNEIYMTSSQENKEEKKRVYNDYIIEGPELVDIENDPVVLRKMADLRKLLEKAPFPEELLKKE